MLNFLEKTINSSSDLVQSSWQIIDLTGVKLTKTTLQKELEEHPDFPSLLSISDVFSSYGLSNTTIKILPSDFEKLPVPFITKQESKNHTAYFAVVKNIDDKVEFYDPQKKRWTKVGKEDFIDQFSGIALLVDAEGDAGEVDYKDLKKEENKSLLTKYLSVFLLPLLFIGFCFSKLSEAGTPGASALVYAVSTLAGCVVCFLLLGYEVNIHNPIINQICTAGPKLNCSAIIHSKGSKIFGISWSTIGFSYFAGNVLILFAGSVTNPDILAILSIFSLCSLPYILYSIYFQWLVIKQWCILCLTIQLILAIQIFICISAGWYKMADFSTLTYGTVIQLLSAYTLPFIILSVSLPAFLGGKKNKTLFRELQRLKHDPDIFNTLLAKQKSTYDTPPIGIILGNPTGKHKIIKVCNPYCSPCARAHKPLEKLLESNPNIQLQIIFSSTSDVADRRRLPVSHLLAIAKEGNEDTTKKALGDWYLKVNRGYEEFSRNYPITEMLELQNPKIDEMLAWTEENKISFTPTIFVNGKQLPERYTINDLKFILAT
jgi:uncharacterized membrane protein